MARAASVVITYRDGKGKAGRTKLFIPSTTAIPDAIAFVQTLAQAIKNVNLAQLTGAKVCFPLDLTVGTSLKAVAAVGSDVQQKVLMMWDTAVSGLYAKFKIPTFDETLLTANTDTIDEAELNTAALITGVEAGIATSTPASVDITNARGMDITDIRKGREIFRNF